MKSDSSSMNSSVSSALDRALRGDRQCLEKIVALLTPVIQARIARALLRHSHKGTGRHIRQEVEDLTQDVFVALFADGARVLRSWDPDRGLSLKNFVGLVADRQAASILRTGRRNPWKEDPTPEEDLDRKVDCRSGTDAGQAMENRVISKELLERALDRLTEESTPLGIALFTLLFVEERPVGQVCDEMKMSKDAVYAWRSRLMRQTRKIIEEILSENG